MLVAGLERVNNPQNLSGISSSGSWVGHDETNGLLWVNDENRSDGEGNSLGIYIGGVLVVQHVIEIGNLPLLVTNDRESQVGARDLVDVLNPSVMRLDGVGGETDKLGTTLGEFRLELSKSSELSGADRSVIFKRAANC